MKRAVQVTVFAIAMLVSISAFARKWTDDTGTFSVEAEFVKLEDGKVHLKRSDTGAVIKVPVDRLSEPDRKHVNSLVQPPPPPSNPAKPSTQPPLGPTATPKLALKVRWGYKSGSSGFVVEPHTWTLTLDLENKDECPWTVFPDLLFGEAAGTSALSAGLSTKYRDNLLYRTFNPPNDTSSESSEFLKIGNVFMSGIRLRRQWNVNGVPSKWEPTELKPGDKLSCVWSHATGTTFKYKDGKDYHIFHLGPVVYDPNNPEVPAYAFSVQAAGDKSTWETDAAELLPLTAAALRQRIDDAALPEDLRLTFAQWLYDHPQPLPDEVTIPILLDLLQKREDCPIALRMRAGQHLAFAGPPVNGRVLALVADRGENPALRAYLAEYLKYNKTDGVRTLLTIAKDGKDVVAVREAALKTLSEDRKGTHWPLIESLRDDADLGQQAKKLLKEREEKKTKAEKAAVETAKASKEQEEAVKGIALLQGQTRLDRIAEVVKKWNGIIETDAAQPGKPIVKVVLHFEKVTDAGLPCLQWLPQLRELDLFYTNVTDAGVRSLRGMSQLRVLSLGGTKVTDAGLLHLKDLTQLENLRLDKTAVTDAGLSHLQPLKRLQTLRLDDTAVTDRGLMALQPLKELRELILPEQITDAGLAALRQLTQLEELYLGGTEVTDAGLKELYGLTKLRKLDLHNTAVTTKGIFELRKALPKVEIER